MATDSRDSYSQWTEMRKLMASLVQTKELLQKADPGSWARVKAHLPMYYADLCVMSTQLFELDFELTLMAHINNAITEVADGEDIS